jgi:hypothetical protein
MHIGVIQKPRKIMVHVWCDHVEDCTSLALPFEPLNSHLFELQDIVMAEHLQKLDLAERSNGESILFIVHQNLFESDDISSANLSSLVDFTECTFAEFT